MAKKASSSRDMRPALTAEARENQLIDLAVSLAEQQLRDGTAKSQVIAHYLKQSTAKSRLELEKLKLEKELIQAKTEALQSAKKVEEMYTEALNAMRRYAGQGSDEEDEYWD